MNKRTKFYCFTVAYFIIGFSTLSKAQLQPALADSMLRFIKANPEKASVFISRNDTTIASYNSKRIMPLASTMKILVAVEFAKQAGSDVINEGQYVALKDLEVYHLAGTDGEAHKNWLEYEKERKSIKNDSIQLIDVARGMIIFSSNANTEYLMDLLGLDNIKNNIQLFGLKNHTAIYPIVASLFMYQNPKKMNEDKVVKAIRKFTEEQYCKVIFAIHNQLKVDTNFKARFNPKDLTEKMQRCWSDRLPASTTEDYVHLAKILNDRRYLDNNAYGVLAHIMEYPMEQKGFQKVFKQYGVKGGSTAFVLTHVLYFITLSDVKMEMAIFFNNLTKTEQANAERWLDPFEAQIIFNKKFRDQLSLNSNAK
jgi:D-alanyl-D-alanine carboxypeptidase